MNTHVECRVTCWDCDDTETQKHTSSTEDSYVTSR